MPKREGPLRFGWCLDGHHEDCKVEVTVQRSGQGYEGKKWERTHRCECQCHTEAGLPR